MAQKKRRERRPRGPQARSGQKQAGQPQPRRQPAPAAATRPETSGHGVALTTIAVIIMLLIAAGIAYKIRSAADAGSSSAGTPVAAGTASPTVSSQAPIIDGMPCNAEDITYHEHAHLAIYDAGTPVGVPAGVGIVDDTCLYWLHTHDDTGEIHMEAPRARTFTLGMFFDVWHQPLSRTQAAGAVVHKGKTMRVYVNGKLYSGNPRNIVLVRHTLVTIEVGPPWEKPVGFDFQGD